jgi:cell wall-associated NlpC family hydrolase
MPGNVVVPLLAVTVGGVLVWSGITNPDGGTFAGLSALFKGQDPAANRPAVFSGVAADLVAVAGPSVGGTGSHSSDSAAAYSIKGGSSGSTLAPPPNTSGSTGSTATGTRAAVLKAAAAWLGVPYKWAGTTRKGVDCSGFTQAVYRTVGINLPRVSAAQALVGKATSIPQPGDLVAFGTPVHHVGIYTGSGQCIHAPHTGTTVRYESVASIRGTVLGKSVRYRNILGSGTSKARTVSA